MNASPRNGTSDQLRKPMNTVDTNVDAVINNAMYPGIIRFGGNTGTPNYFVGIDTGDLTGSVYNGVTLLEGNNLSCFLLLATQAGLMDSASPLLEPAGQFHEFLNRNLGPQISALGCPQLESFNNEILKKYFGASYTAEGQ